MKFDAFSLEQLRGQHAAWRLLHYERAPLAVAFLHATFVSTNARSVAEDTAIELLDDQLFALRSAGDDSSSKSAREYLIEWASDARGFVRRYYPLGGEDAHMAITPGAERAITWLTSLAESNFVGTESRLLTAIELLRQLDIGTDANVDTRLADLHRRRAEIDAEIARVSGGDVRLLDDRAVAERFQQFAALARELLADFRQVEENFRSLDRSVRERIARWDGSKGDLLDDVLGERDVITSSDQGSSFRAFWELLSSVARQDELTDRLHRIMSLPPIVLLSPDRRLRKVHHDWFDAGDHTQRTVASLSAQLRRFLDDKTWLENRHIVETLRSIEQQALAVRHERPKGVFHEIAQPSAEILLPMERRLASSTATTAIEVSALLDDDEADLANLFADTRIDPLVLADHIDDLLIDRAQVTLAHVCERRPLAAGLAELVTYLHLDDDRFERTFVEGQQDRIVWTVESADATDPADSDVRRAVDMPRVVFVRG